MSRSDNQNTDGDKKLSKRLIITLSIFAVVAIGATTGAIIWKNSQESYESDEISLSGGEKVNEQDKKFYNESKLVVRRGDIYATNPLKITWTVGGKDSRGNDESYAQISGLKNQDLQGRINGEIKAAFDQVNEGKLANGANYKYARCDVKANFANILSVACFRIDQHSYYVKGTSVSDIISEKHAYLNYRLDTGEKLKFNDVFVAGSNMNALVTTAFYETWSRNTDNFVCGDGSVIDEINNPWCDGKLQPTYPADIEERALMAVRSFQQQPETDFLITFNGVTFVVGDQELTLNFLNNYNQIAIYKRFADAKDLYDGQFNQEYGFVFLPAYRTALGKVSDNVFVDCNNLLDDNADNPSNGLLQESNNLVGQRIAEAKQRAAKTPDRAIVLTCSTEYWSDSTYWYSQFRSGDLKSIRLYSTIFTMPKTYFEQTGWQKILDANYSPHPDVGTHSSGAFTGENYDKENVSSEESTKAVFWVDNRWQDLTNEYRDWLRVVCTAIGQELDEDNLYCRSD
ncbi:hypothetical protein FWG95_01315 [Candidatus Saccharibacteria bacterium]|nr:hypothetical protein [Candidatus Saccharibacteria bacterium]